MSLQTLAFLLGCGLIVIGIVGGGIEAKEIKVPKLSPLPRFLSAIFGIGLVAGAAGGLSGLASQGSALPQAAAAAMPALPAGAGAVNGSAAPPPTSAAATPATPVPPAAGDAAAGNGSAAAEAEADPRQAAPVTEAAAEREGLRTIRITDSLGPEQDYERIQLFIGGRQVALISIDRNHPRQSFSVDVRDGDEYVLVGAEASTVDGVTRVRTIRGSGIFDADGQSSYILWSDDQTAEVVTAELRAQEP